jgi:hypothetical protein
MMLSDNERERSACRIVIGGNGDVAYKKLTTVMVFITCGLVICSVVTRASGVIKAISINMIVYEDRSLCGQDCGSDLQGNADIVLDCYGQLSDAYLLNESVRRERRFLPCLIAFEALMRCMSSSDL